MNETIKQIRFMPDDEIYDIQANVTRQATSETGSRVVEITDGADAPLVKCVTQITGYQSGTGTPSPDNIRPIVAYTEGEIEVRGKNTWNEQTKGGYYNEHTGNYVSGVTQLCSNDYTPISPNTYYYCYKGSNTNLGEIIFYDSNHDYISSLNPQNWINKKFVTPTNAAYYTFNLGSNYGTTYKNNICINKSDSNFNGNYEPYTSTTHTTTYTSAIYRGSEDCVNGTVTTEWGVIASYAGETLPGEWISDRDEYAPGTTPTTGAQVAYEFATPTTAPVTVSNRPIKSISAYSHIESTTGDMEVEYITQGEQPILDLITDEKVKQTNYTTSSYIGDTFTLPFSKDNTSTTGTSDLYKNTGIAVRVRADETWLTTMDSGSTEDTTLNQTAVRSTGVQVMNRTSTTDIPNTMTVTPTDIQLTGTNNTWDGINFSLKSALSALADTYEKTIYVTGLGSVDIGGDLDYNQSIMVTYYITYKYDNVDYCVYDSYFGRSAYGSGSWGYGHTLEFAVTDKTPQQYTKGTHLHVGVNSYYGAPLAVGVWCNSEDESHITNIDGLIKVVIDRNPLTIS